MTKVCACFVSKCPLPDYVICYILVSFLGWNIGLYSLKQLSPLLFVVCEQHGSFAFCLLRVLPTHTPENRFVRVDKCFLEYEKVAFRLNMHVHVSTVDLLYSLF